MQRNKVDAQGGLACLAQARQNRPGIGELDLTNIIYADLTGFRRNLIDSRFVRALIVRKEMARIKPVRSVSTDDSLRRSGYRDRLC